jgi:hypothetical protein
MACEGSTGFLLESMLGTIYFRGVSEIFLAWKVDRDDQRLSGLVIGMRRLLF